MKKHIGADCRDWDVVACSEVEGQYSVVLLSRAPIKFGAYLPAAGAGELAVQYGHEWETFPGAGLLEACKEYAHAMQHQHQCAGLFALEGGN